MKKFFTFLLFSLCILTKSTFAADGILEWDDNSDADYYVVYWSTDPDTFDEANSMEVPGGITYVELEGSPNNQTYYFTVKAFNTYGNSSDYSDLVMAARVPADVSYGDVLDPKDIADTDETTNNNGGGCFIGSSFF